VKVQKVSETLEIGHIVRQASKPVVSEIEHAKLFQPADARGHLGQLVIGQYQCFELGLFPY
jgi:hypothetical protein